MGALYNVERTAVILAGCDDTAKAGVVRRLANSDGTPLASGALLERANRCVEAAIAPEKILFVVNQIHERDCEALLCDAPKSSLVVQPESKGSAPAILLALLRMAAMAPDGSVAIFPADRFINNEREFMRHVEVAFDVVEQRPELTVLLAMEPSHPDTGYGWVEPAQRISFGRYDLHRVAALRERTADIEDEARMLGGGYLSNSAVAIGRLSTILSTIMVSAPELYSAFAPLRAKLPQAPSVRSVERIYRDLPCIGFSQHVLGVAPVNLAALAMAHVCWTDFGGHLRPVPNQPRLKRLWSIAS